VTWWAFLSCTTSLSVLESDLYLGTVGTRTLFSTETINGRTINSHSHFTNEDEIMLLPGSFFEVKSRLNPAPVCLSFIDFVFVAFDFSCIDFGIRKKDNESLTSTTTSE